MKKKYFIGCTILVLLFIINHAYSQNKQFSALLITKTDGWHHESINEGVAAIKALAVRNFFDVQWHQDAIAITDKYLKNFQVIIFLNTTGDIFKEDEKKSIERFIQSGKGYVGIHSASDTEYEWPWYTKLVGRMFHIHPVIQTAKLNLTNTKFPGLQGFNDRPLWTDEWYEFGSATTSELNYILSVDESTYNPKAEWADKNKKGVDIMAEARSLFQIAGYLIVFPGVFLSLTVLAVNMLGDGLRDALDPRLARRL